MMNSDKLKCLILSLIILAIGVGSGIVLSISLYRDLKATSLKGVDLIHTAHTVCYSGGAKAFEGDAAHRNERHGEFFGHISFRKLGTSEIVTVSGHCTKNPSMSIASKGTTH